MFLPKLFLLVPIISTSFSGLLLHITTTEKPTLEQYELRALRAKQKEREYIIDFTGIKECNKSRIKYLGTFKTQKGKTYKVLTSVHVYKTSSDNCHGSSTIKFYNLKNQFVGKYEVGMPDDLPASIIGNKLFFCKELRKGSKQKTGSVNLFYGLPKSFFIQCSETGGNSYSFSN